MEDFFYRYRELYERLPLPIRHAAGLLVGAVPQRVRHGSFYSVYRKRIAEFVRTGSTWRSKGLQLSLLRQTVDFAICRVPFYKDASPIRDYEDLEQFPVVSRDDYKNNTRAFRDVGAEGRTLSATTGGSSGSPLTFYVSRGVCRPKEKAHFHWLWGLYGYRPRCRILVVRGKPLANNRLLEYRSCDNCLAVSCYELKESNSHRVVEAIRRFRPEFVHAYPSALKLFCQVLRDPDTLGASICFRAVFVGSEMLAEEDRSLFAEFFHAPIVTWYGHSECVLHGGDMPGAAGFHFFPFYGYFELLDESGAPITQPGCVGRIVGTSFDNFVMPFIRYDTGDLGVLASDPERESTCGWPLLERIEGRAQDFIYLSDGSRIHLTGFIFGQHLRQFKGIREMQLEQNVVGKLVMRIVRSSDFRRADEKEMIARLCHSVANRVQISAEYVDRIPKTRRGKHVFLIQNIHDSKPSVIVKVG